MATSFGVGPSTILRTNTTTTYFTSSSQPPPPPPPSQPSQPQLQPPQQLSTTATEPPLTAKLQEEKPRKSGAESTDWIASTLTRRFGLGAGLAWAGFLAIGVLSEQIKTRFEVSQQEANTRDVEKEVAVTLPNGIRYYELRIGGGETPRKGDLVVIDVKGKVEGSDEVFVDTFDDDDDDDDDDDEKKKKKKPLALVLGSRPYNKGICDGVEVALKSMKVGGKRRVIIPPNLCFGEDGADLGSGLQIPPYATIEYVIQLDKVSIAPA